MYISSLQIDRFGSWTNVVLDALSDGLNVFYGPRCSDTTTIAHFIRSMLYGFDDVNPAASSSEQAHGIAGALVVRGPVNRQTIRRWHETDSPGRLIIENSDGSMHEHPTWYRIMDTVPASLFDGVFAIGAADATAIERAIEQAISQGLELVGQPVGGKRLADLKEQLRARSRELAELKTGDWSFDQLTAQRRHLQQEIDALQTAGQDRRASVDRQLRKLDGELADLEEQLEELQQELHLLDAQIESRQAERQRKENEYRTARADRQQARERRRDALREVDAQLERWRCVLQDLEARGRQLRETAGLIEIPELHDATDPRDCLQRLEGRVEDLQMAVAGSQPGNHPDACECRSWRSTFEAALGETRDDIYRLCNALSRWETETVHTKQSSELGQLGRCEAELRAAIAGLSRRRHRLLSEMAQTGDMTGELLTPIAPQLCACKDHPAATEHMRPSEALSEAEQDELQLLSSEIDQLISRRHEVQRDLATVEDEVHQLQQQRSQLELEVGPRNNEGRLANLRQERQRVDERLARWTRRRELSKAIEQLESEIHSLERLPNEPSVLREASDLLRRLTAGELQAMTLNERNDVLVQYGDGQCRGCDQLPLAARTQVHLSLRLAVATTCARRGTRLPLILDDALVNLDAASLRMAARLLRQIAQDGQQVLVFTRHLAVAEAFRRLDIQVREPSTREHVAAPSADLSDDVRREVNRQLSAIAEEQNPQPKVVEYAAWNAEEFPGELTDRVRPEKRADIAPAVDDHDIQDPSEFFLWESSPIHDAPSIDAATAERFRKIDVLLVRDLLRLDVQQAAERLRYAGITARMIRRWQSEALLTCRVPHLRPYDARILVGCGIEDPDQLAQIDAAELRRRVEQFAVTSTGQVLLRAGNRYELSRVTDWIRAARRRHGRGSRQPETRRSGRSSENRRSWDRTADRREQGQRPAATEPSRRPATTRKGSQRMVLKLDEGQESLRFYLNTSDPLEAAPSIGPRTAERFAAIGITTVAQFLNSDPETMARRLNRRRVTAARIRSWQQQTTLACRIPWLRGHDAQILVACGITDAESLAGMEADALWKIVQPFLATSQCRRIIRSGKAPDFEEVYSWIQWARNARLLQAA